MGVFLNSKEYTRKDIYKILNVPTEKQKGSWNTGYHEYNGNIFIFSNVGIPGRTGHDYNNYWDGDLFIWEAKNRSNVKQPLIKRMISPQKNQKIFLFTRTADRMPFTFEGEVVVKEYHGTSPVKITWKFLEYPYGSLEEKGIEELSENHTFWEGSVKQTVINKYERNPLARRICIKFYGLFCSVCNFDFQKTYGELGKGYIHVHHIIPISKLGKRYILEPEKDLIPICPNCHCMLHKKSPPMKPSTLKQIVRDQQHKNS